MSPSINISGFSEIIVSLSLFFEYLRKEKCLFKSVRRVLTLFWWEY